mmetsp:Transcript_16653/g.38888  ORF Transcript_16653/g.38888 Transcript_16653/m.38888 type:complete len:216 (-) Transcript_16653:48-695(-)
MPLPAAHRRREARRRAARHRQWAGRAARVAERWRWRRQHGSRASCSCTRRRTSHCPSRTIRRRTRSRRSSASRAARSDRSSTTTSCSRSRSFSRITTAPCIFVRPKPSSSALLRRCFWPSRSPTSVWMRSMPSHAVCYSAKMRLYARRARTRSKSSSATCPRRCWRLCSSTCRRRRKTASARPASTFSWCTSTSCALRSTARRSCSSEVAPVEES